jgi:hypothetical protein
MMNKELIDRINSFSFLIIFYGFLITWFKVYSLFYHSQAAYGNQLGGPFLPPLPPVLLVPWLLPLLVGGLFIFLSTKWTISWAKLIIISPITA